ncbi:MAG: hypothetical protein ACXVB0_11485 [Mucilaginibacter sp.]
MKNIISFSSGKDLNEYPDIENKIKDIGKNKIMPEIVPPSYKQYLMTPVFLVSSHFFMN